MNWQSRYTLPENETNVLIGQPYNDRVYFILGFCDYENTWRDKDGNEIFGEFVWTKLPYDEAMIALNEHKITS